jgi:hypothetical protein
MYIVYKYTVDVAYNLPWAVYVIIKAVYMYNQCTVYMYLLGLGLPEKAMEWLPLSLGLVAEDKPTEFSCTCTCTWNTELDHFSSTDLEAVGCGCLFG